MSISLIVNGLTYLVDTIDTTGHPHTAAYLLEMSNVEIENIEREFKVKVGSVVTDGAANMLCMRKELSTERDIITYGCQAHLLNLLAKEVQQSKHQSDGIASIMEKLPSILKYLRNVQAASAQLI